MKTNTNTNLDKRIRLANYGELESTDTLFKEIDDVLSIRYNHYNKKILIKWKVKENKL